MADLKIKIEDLDPTLLPSRLHYFPAMKDGITVRLSVGQIIDLLVEGAPTALDTWMELVDAIEADQASITSIMTALGNRVRFDAAQTLTALQKAQAIANIGASDIASDYIQDMILSNDATFPNTHITVGTGRLKAGSIVLSNSSALTKRLDQNWVAGNNNGGLDTGVKGNNGTYFLYALQKASDGSFDYAFSTSATVAGVNTALLAGYTVAACIGVALTDGSGNIRQFIMYPRDEYLWVTPVNDLVNAAIGTGGALGTLAVPNGVKVRANLRFMYTSGSTTAGALIHDPAQGSLSAGGGNAGSNVGTIQVASSFAVGSDEVWTNISRQVRYVAGASGQLNLWTDGFIFPCKRIA